MQLVGVCFFKLKSEMNIKKRILEKSIKSLKKRIAKIDKILESTPLQDVINIRIEAQKLLNNAESDERFSKDFIEKINVLSAREKATFKMAKKKNNTIALIKKKVELEFEKNDYETQLWYLNR